MKEKSQQGHSGTAVAPDTARQPLQDFKESTSQSFDDDENEWELGVGNLIIDLDADLERNSTSPISGQTETSPKMSGIEHHATVDKGLKMKIKRKSGGAKSETKHEIVKNDLKMATIGEAGATVASPIDNKKQSPGDNKDKTGKGSRAVKKDKVKDKLCRTQEGAPCIANGFPSGNSNSNEMSNSLLETDKLPFGIKRELPPMAALDPYEFNAKVEDRISMPVKKIKLEKNDAPSCPGATCIPNQIPRTVAAFQNMETASISQTSHDASTETTHIGTITEPDCLGPCEPGTSVSLEGIVWQETENGVLVVNVTWRGKTYVGTLMDSTKHDWAPPRFTCDSPTSDFEARTPKGRAKRGGRGSTSTPLNDMSNYTERKLRKGRRGGNNNFQAPPSPAKSDVTPVAGMKRKGRPAELDLSASEESGRSCKRNRSNSRSTPTPAAATNSSNSNISANEPVVPPGSLIQCPEPNCNKKYRHINGLRYHQSHAHTNNTSEDKEDSTRSTSSGDSRPTTPATPVVTANNVDQSNGHKTPIKRNTRDSESKSKSRLDSSSDKPKEVLKDSSVVEDKKSEAEPVGETVAEVDKKVSTIVGSQVYQISGGAISRVTGASVVPKPSSELNTGLSSVPVTLTTVTAVTVPIATVSTLPAQPGKVDSKEEKKKKTDKADKTKVVKPTTITRPIVPAPTPQTLTLTSNGPMPHSTLTVTNAQAQISPTLKAIQPKPTVMGEPSTINPALIALKEKKPKHKKKNKEKERSKSPRDLLEAKEDTSSAIDSKVKAQLQSVIKPVPATVPESRDGADNNELKQDSAKLSLLKEHEIKLEPGTLLSRVQPPSSLSLNTRLEVSTPDPADHGSESVQSPAYSDISDAADSEPSKDNDGDLKQKDVPPSEVPGGEHNPDPSLPAYGIYPYYHSQAPYLIPAIPQTQAQTQPTNAPPSNVGTNEPSGSKPQEVKPSAAVSKVVERAEDGQEIKKEPMTSPQLAREYRVPSQQKVIAQSLYAHPQYQYFTSLGYNIDPQYHMHLMANDPNYREKHEKFMEEQERRKEQVLKQEREKPVDKEKATVAPKPPQLEPGKVEKTRPVHAVSPMVTSDQKQKMHEPKLSPHVETRDKVEMTLKEKQNENLQILKENMELKPQMDNRPKQPGNQDSYDSGALFERQRDELQRYYMYQQKKLVEQRLDDDGRPIVEGPKGDGKKPDIKVLEQVKDKGSPRDSPVIKREQTPSDLSKKDSNPSDRSKNYRDKSDERGRPAERPRTDEKGRTRSPNVTPKLRSAEGVPSAVPSSAGMVPAHYAQYMPPGYMQSHAAYAQFPYDPSTMYRHGIIPGYPPGAGYVHPAAAQQVRYHMSPMDLEKEKSAALSSPNAASPMGPGEQPKALDLLQQHASHYYSSHKIHELEKTRPVASPSGKPPSGSSSPSVPTSSYQKPREYRQSPPPQRHVHTHHHTHLVGGYPIPPYDPYSAIIATGSVAAASSITEPIVPPKQ